MALRLLKLSCAYVWSATMVLGGMSLWRRPQRLSDLAGLIIGADAQVLGRCSQTLAVCAIAGGMFSFMFFVADDLCPDAPMLVSGFLKVFSGALMWLSLGWSLWLAVGY